jgi:ABC-type branched-subunit amino acid transport system substrate-binding protein
MRSSIDRPVLEEPWTKRLKATRSRSVKGGQEQLHSDHLPSPKPTNPSSTDNIPSSSSSSDQQLKSKANPVQSLKDRLVPLPKKPTPFSLLDGAAAPKKSTSRPSVAPFFQRIEAAFRDNPTITTKASHTSTTTRAQAKARFPSPDAEDLIQQLKGPSIPDHRSKTHPN